MTGLASSGETAVITALTGSPYVSLHTGDPGNTTGVNEVTGGSYARVGPITFSNAGANPTVASNSSILTFPTATASWGTVTFFGLWSASSGGTYYGSGTLTSTPVNNGDTARFPANALTITVG
jgi:hypothetical protein